MTKRERIHLAAALRKLALLTYAADVYGANRNPYFLLGYVGASLRAAANNVDAFMRHGPDLNVLEVLADAPRADR